MKVGSKVRILLGDHTNTGIVTNIVTTSNGYYIVDVQQKNMQYPSSYWMKHLKEIKPKPIKLKQFSAWK